MRPAHQPQWTLLLLAMSSLAASCASPSFFIPGDTPPKPPGHPARSIVIACDEAPRRVVVSEAASLRLVGPLSVDVTVPPPGKPATQGAAPASVQKVPANAELKVTVQGLEKGGNEWGALCFCRGFLGTACTPDCEDADSRIDVRVSCPATQFAKKEDFGRISPPLPAHLPVEITCKRGVGAAKQLHCEPTLVALEAGELTVFGALRLAPPQSSVEARISLTFVEAETSVPQASGSSAFLCLRNACSNPAYFLPLTIKFEQSEDSKVSEPPSSKVPSTSTPPSTGAMHPAH